MASQLPMAVGQRGALQRMSMDPLLMVQRDMDRLFGNLVRSMVGSEGSNGELALAPRIDVRQTEGGAEIDAELPGADEQDVEVSLEGDELTIAGEIRREHQDEKNGYRLAERQVGRFRRVIQLPFEPDPDKVDAEFRNGLLIIQIASPPQKDRTKRIALKSGERGAASSQQSDPSAKPAEAQREAEDA